MCQPKKNYSLLLIKTYVYRIYLNQIIMLVWLVLAKVNSCFLAKLRSINQVWLFFVGFFSREDQWMKNKSESTI